MVPLPRFGRVGVRALRVHDGALTVLFLQSNDSRVPPLFVYTLSFYEIMKILKNTVFFPFLVNLRKTTSIL